MRYRKAIKNYLLAYIVIAILSNLSILFAQGSGKNSSEEISARVKIYRDEFGVPHIFGKTDADAVFGFAYAQAEDNFFLIEDSFIKSIGRSSEIDGEDGLLYDKVVKALEIPRLAQEEYLRASYRMRAIYDSYASGLNYYLTTHPAIKPVLLKQLEPWHTIALLKYKYYVLEFIWNAGLKKKDFSIYTEENKIEKNNGSNAWAVMPIKSESGNALLFQNPHVGFYGPATYYEGHLHSEEGLNFSGAGRYGFPFPYLGHNEYLGWSYTDNDIDNGDLYMETFDNKLNPLAYKYGNKYKVAVEWDETFIVKTNTGTETRKVTFRKTDHGPIVSEYDKKPVAVKLAKLEEGGWYDQWFEMMKAKSLPEFKTILKKVDVPYMNITYADKDGNIFYCYYGTIPKRSTNFNWRLPVEGSDPETDWKGYHSFEELPQALNPKSGFIQNCNSSPFVTSLSGNPDESFFPSYMFGPLDDNNPRSQVSREILSSSEIFSFETWQKAVVDTRVHNAKKFIEKLLTEFEILKGADAQRTEKLINIINEFKSWDCVSRKESAAMTLFTMTTLANITESYFKSYDYQISAPTIQRLEAVKDYLEKTWGVWKVPWGEINRLQKVNWNGKEPFDDNKPSYPIAGGPGNIGIVFNFYWNSYDLQIDKPRGLKRRYGIAGNSYVSVVEFSPKINARSIVYYGQSGDSASPHYFDQAKLYSEGKFKPAWFYIEDIIKHSEAPYHPGAQK